MNFNIWLAKFRLLRDDNGNQLRQNVRPTQLLHERVVMYRPDMMDLYEPNFNPTNPFVSFPNLFSAFPNVFQLN
jgi:carbonic anhydrase